MTEDLLLIRRQALADALTLDQVAQETLVPARTLRGRAERREIGVKVGPVWLFLPEDLLALVAADKPGPKRRAQ